MPRRSIRSARQRGASLDLPTDEASMLRHCTLSDDAIEQIRVRRGGHNRLGFALQLCAFRYPGRLLAVGEAIPLNVLGFIAAQLGMGVEDLDGYAIWEETRREHLAELRRIAENGIRRPCNYDDGERNSVGGRLEHGVASVRRRMLNPNPRS